MTGENVQGNRPAWWLKVALFNFVAVAFVGIALRYKLTFPFPQMDFKNLLHAHSHFAFAGWVSAALFAVIIAMFTSQEQQQQRTFRMLFWFSQLTSYGMLFGFLVQEYGPVSIGFSTAYIFVTYGFAVVLWRYTRGATSLSVKALRASLIFLAISSAGPYALAYIKAAHIISGELYHNSIYWYLHFQYNGWFSFAVFALFLRWCENRYPERVRAFRAPYMLMLVASVPCYLLSILWIVPPLWVYILGGIGGTLQLIALLMIVRQLLLLRKHVSFVSGVVRNLFLFSIISFVIKLLLQFLSVFPVLNQFVFGHRPVIIGYLHLVMLGFITFFVFAYAASRGLMRMHSTLAKSAVWIFVGGVLLNETGLMLQGFVGILETPMKWIPVVLFTASLIMFSGLLLLAISQRSKHGQINGGPETSLK